MCTQVYNQAEDPQKKPPTEGLWLTYPGLQDYWLPALECLIFYAGRLRDMFFVFIVVLETGRNL